MPSTAPPHLHTAANQLGTPFELTVCVERRKRIKDLNQLLRSELPTTISPLHACLHVEGAGMLTALHACLRVYLLLGALLGTAYEVWLAAR